MPLRTSSLLVCAFFASTGVVLAHPGRTTDRIGAATTTEDNHRVAEPGTRSPAPVTTPSVVIQDDAAAMTAWLGTYDAAFNAKGLEELASFYHPDANVSQFAVPLANVMVKTRSVLGVGATPDRQHRTSRQRVAQTTEL